MIAKLFFILFTLISINKKDSSDCEIFYQDQAFTTLILDGEIFKKEATDNVFSLQIKPSKSKHLQTVRFFKNKKTAFMFNFCAKGDIIRKDHGTWNVRIAHFKKDGNLDVRVFDELCE